MLPMAAVPYACSNGLMAVLWAATMPSISSGETGRDIGFIDRLKGGCLWVRLAMSTIFLCSGERSVLYVVGFFDIVSGFKSSSCP